MNPTPQLAIARLSPSTRAVSGRLFVLSVTLVLLFGCRELSVSWETDREHSAPSADTTSTNADSTKPAAATFPLQVTDGLHRELTLPGIPQRIVSLAPKNTEMLFALGAGGQIVGVTSYCNYPPAATHIEQVGGFSSKSLSLERIVSLQPDLVVSAGDLHAPIIKELERLGLPVFALTADSFAGLSEELRLLGRITGHEDEAARMVPRLQERIDRVRQTARGIPTAERVTVFYHVWGEPLTAAGPTSYLGEMIQLCGGLNIIDDATTRFPKISLEVLLARDPDVILSSTDHAASFSERGLQSRPGWSDLRAVRHQRIHLLDGDLVSRCSPRLVDALELMAHALYPAHFAAPQTELTAHDNREGAHP